ncbi:MAG TPA: hypothetical protein IGS53_25550 [Leptolyngbyaceae cyanobacterium M33_DOE_097]|nr:hypothetical protein [Leptolyngbyaceae cyanobacterium M33_DOE_097]
MQQTYTPPAYHWNRSRGVRYVSSIRVIPPQQPHDQTELRPVALGLTQQRLEIISFRLTHRIQIL